MSDSPICNLEFLEYLEQFITEHKISLINDVLENRTRHFTIVLEDFYQSQNASATLRTSECLGIQDVHIVENYNPFQINPDITLGSSKWLSLHQYNEETGSNPNNTERCISNLKDLGYLIVATSLSAPSISLYDLPITKKLAIIFGNERDGLSSTALQMSDLHMRLPQYGFTQSYVYCEGDHKMDEIVIMESLSMRQRLCTEGNTAVLDRVGRIVFLAGTKYSTVQQIANFYQIDLNTLQQVTLYRTIFLREIDS